MGCSARIGWWRNCLVIILLIICHRGLSAQEIDLYDYRYYRLFEEPSQITDDDITPKSIVPIFTLDPNFSTFKLDYNLSFVRSTRRGVSQYQSTTTFNGIEVPYIGSGVARRLQLGREVAYGCSDSGLGSELRLRIDSIRQNRSSVGVRFLSRNMPYSISASASYRLSRGWSISADMIARTGRDIYVEGLFGNSLKVDIVATKEINRNNRISLALFIEPSMRGSRLSSTAEAFRLTGNNLYNPAWGFQSGKIRNSRVRRSILPTALVAYEGILTERTRVDIGFALTSGVEKYSALEWFNAQTPAPDNYRYMPSYFDDEEDIFTQVESAWLQDDTRYTQIDFDRLIATNMLADGEAVYAIADRVNRIVRTSSHAAFTTQLNSGDISYGVDVSTDNSRKYKQMRDLLGAEYIVDVDYFLVDDDTYSNSLQNNLDNPNRRVEVGGRYGYDYALRTNRVSAFAKYRFAKESLRLDISARVGMVDISRKGYYRKELFADNSFGVSRKAQLPYYRFRAYSEYILASRHLFSASIMADADACDAEDYFIQTQYNNRLVEQPKSRKGYSIDFRYLYQRPAFSISATLFATATIDDSRVEHIYDDLSGEYADIVTTGIDVMRYGVEVESQYRFAKNFRASLAMCLGRYHFVDNAQVTTYSDKSNIILADKAKSYVKNLSIGNAPQITMVAAISYYNRGWWATIDANYAGLRFVEPSLVMRTERALSMAISPEQRKLMSEQERLRDGFTLDISLSKSLFINRLDKKIYRSRFSSRFADKYPRARILLRVGVRNILGSRNTVYSARESSRLQRYKIADDYIYSRQATRYTYAYPRVYEVSASLRF